MNFDDQLRSISVRKLAKLACVSEYVIQEARRTGKLKNSPSGRRVHSVLESMFGELANVDSSPNDNCEEPLSIQLNREDLRLKRARRIELERKNAVAASKLVPVDEVLDRVKSAGITMRNRSENARRAVEAICCSQCKAIVVDVLDAEYRLLVKQVANALRGKPTH